VQLEQQRVAVGSGNAHLISICQVSSDAAMHATAAAAAAAALAVLRLLLPSPPLLHVLLCICNLMMKNNNY